MAENQSNPQYFIILELLSEYAKSFCECAQIIFAQEGWDWDAQSAQFEVDVYFLFVLSCTLLNYGHDREVWEELMFFCEDALVERYAGLSSADDLRDVIASRVERYGRITNGCIERHDKPIWSAWIEWVCRSITASAVRKPIEANPPIIIGSFLERWRIEAKMLPVQFEIGGAFGCCLKHLFQGRSDFRGGDTADMLRRIRSAQQEAQEIRARGGAEIRTLMEKQLRLPYELWQKLRHDK